MLRSWTSWRASASAIRVFDPSFQASDGEQGFVKVGASRDLLSEPRPAVLVVAVKPQQLIAAVADLGLHIDESTLVVSVAAGVSLAELRKLFPGSRACVRAMPNTPIAIGQGVTVLCAEPRLDQIGAAAVEQLFRAGGAVHWLAEEALLPAVTAVSGCGPAYVFHFTESLAQAGVGLGLSKELADALARECVAGSAALGAASHQSLTQLRIAVASPGGATEAGLEVLMREEGSLSDLMVRTLNAASSRARALGQAAEVSSQSVVGPCA